MLQIIDYSAKAVAVVGNTKDYASQLKSLGGRFNPRLTCGAGWIFPKKAIADLEALANGQPIEKKETENESRELLKDARVYVGTYHKYNCGSLGGKWLNLADYANKAEFLKACRELHKDEQDPEFMFQGYEGIPSWLIGESHIDAEVWEQKAEKEDKARQTKEQIRDYYVRCGSRGDIDYEVKSTALIVETEDGKCFAIGKPSIETDFCHPDEPEESVRAWWKVCRTYEYFRNENMMHLQETIETLTKKECDGTLDGLFIHYDTYTGMWRYGYNASRCYLNANSNAIPMDEQTRQSLLKGYKEVAQAFEKRLAGWWKRYGADKLHCWTYWADR